MLQPGFHFLLIIITLATGSTGFGRIDPRAFAGTWTTDPADPKRGGELELILTADPDAPDILHIHDSTPASSVYRGKYRVDEDTLVRLPNGRREDPYRELSWRLEDDEFVVTKGGVWRPQAYVGTRLVRLLPDPFFDAIRTGNSTALKARPRLREDIETTVDQIGRTALYVATVKRQATVLELLLDSGVAIDLRNRDLRGETALHAAVRRGDPRCLSLLLERGMDVNTLSGHGRTPLMAAGETCGHYGTMLEILLIAGADPGAVNTSGETARDILVRAGAKNFIRIYDAKLEEHRLRLAVET